MVNADEHKAQSSLNAVSAESAAVCSALGFAYKNRHKRLFADDKVQYILKGLNLSVRCGQFVILSGRSGSGKTTLLNILGGLISFTEGEASVFGCSLKNMSDREKAQFRQKNIGFIFQDAHLDNRRTIMQNVMLPVYFSDSCDFNAADKALFLLKKLGIEKYTDRFPYELSGGQKQRAAAARALMRSPRLILADEPFSHLDPDNSASLIDIIDRFRTDCGCTIIMTSHNMPDSLKPKASVSLNLEELQTK